MGRKQAQATAAPAALDWQANANGLAESNSADRLSTALRDLKTQALLPYLLEAVEHVKADRYDQAGELALKALQIDDHCAAAWHVLAVCREKAGDFTNSLKCYDRAFALDPTDQEIAYNLGHLAFRMNMKPIAEQLFRHFLTRQPHSPEGVNNLACALRDQLRFDEAVEITRAAIYANPESALLWNTLGTILSEQGNMELAITFYDEALRLKPDFAKARYNRANAFKCRGELDAAIADCEAALEGVTLENEVATMRFALSTMRIAAGDLARGWEEHEHRFDLHHPDTMLFFIDRPQWAPGDDIAGRTLLVIAEQGLGDEVMFANLLPDVVEALGPQGRMLLAVEVRLVSLFQRSFPNAVVGPHATGHAHHRAVRSTPFIEDFSQVDLWTPLASLLRQFRPTPDAFPDRVGFLKPDPERVAHWRRELAALGSGPKIGLVWKSLKVDSMRARFYSPFERMKSLLDLQGVHFVNLQYGECDAELQLARDRFGVEIWRPPGLDLKNDLEGVAALACALDLSFGPPTATTNLAGACGAPVWMLSTPGAWPDLGTGRYPWYPQLRLFKAEGYRWDEVMAEVAQAISDQFGLARAAA